MNNAIQQMISDGIKVFAYEPAKNTPPDNFKMVWHWDKIDTLNQGATISDDLNYSILPDFRHVDLDFDCQTAKDNSFAYFNPSYLFGRNERGHMLQVISNPTPFTRIQVSFGSKVLIEMRGERNYSVAQGRLDNLGQDTSNAYSKKTDYGKPMSFEECKRNVFEVGLICQLAEGYYGSVNDYIIPIVGELLFQGMKIDHTKEITERFLRAIGRDERVEETFKSIDSMYKKNNPSKLERLHDWTDTQRAQVRNSIKEVLGDIKETKAEEKKPVGVPPLETKTLKEINHTEYPPLLEIVKNILSPGLWFFSAKPKVGKSFMGLSLVYAVAMGKKFLGFDTEQGSCLYIAYEDSEPRINRRSESMGLEDSENVEFAFKTEKLMLGLEEQLIGWIELKKQNGSRPLLIVIDTYIRSQDGKKGAGNNSYEIDSNKLDRLQQEILSREVCCMFITHDKKVEEGDKLNNMSGSMTFQGQDGVWRMDKNRTDGTMNSVLSIFPRDMKDQQFEVHFNNQNEWENVGTPEVKTMDKQTRLITQAVETISESMGDAKPKEIIEWLIENNLLEDNDRNKWAYTKKIASMKKQGKFVVGERYASVKFPIYVVEGDKMDDNCPF